MYIYSEKHLMFARARWCSTMLQACSSMFCRQMRQKTEMDNSVYGGEKTHSTECKHGWGRIIVWGYITASGTGQLAIIEEIMSQNTREEKREENWCFWVAKSSTYDLKTAFHGQHAKILEILMTWNGFVGRNGLKCLKYVHPVTPNAQILPITPLTWRNL